MSPEEVPEKRLLLVGISMPVIERILSQNSILCGFPVSSFTISGRFRSRYRLMPWRVFFVCLFLYFTWFSGCIQDWRRSADILGKLS
jgi:hypothetical protein